MKMLDFYMFNYKNFCENIEYVKSYEDLLCMVFTGTFDAYCDKEPSQMELLEKCVENYINIGVNRKITRNDIIKKMERHGFHEKNTSDVIDFLVKEKKVKKEDNLIRANNALPLENKKWTLKLEIDPTFVKP